MNIHNFSCLVLVHTQTYTISLLVAVIIGAGKALRTIFMALVIPSYVSLERLPAASGLQLATSGLLFIVLGPIVGKQNRKCFRNLSVRSAPHLAPHLALYHRITVGSKCSGTLQLHIVPVPINIFSFLGIN